MLTPCAGHAPPAFPRQAISHLSGEGLHFPGIKIAPTKDSADEDGKFAIGLRITVQDGAPAKLKVKCSISKTVTDEPERSGDSQQHAARRARRSRGKSKARSKSRRR